MVNLTKSPDPPESLEKEKQKTNGSYRCADVLNQLRLDFLNKCYICEDKEITNLNVEHFKPHGEDKNLKFGWNNLFYSCPHCNNTKNLKPEFNNILNCTNPNHDVENWLKYKMEFFPKKVIITQLKNCEIVINTVNLLDAVYNGGTDLKKIEADNLKKKILKELREFEGLLVSYFEENLPADDKEKTKTSIKRELSKFSAFTAFKRWIIKENNFLKKEFEIFFD